MSHHQRHEFLPCRACRILRAELLRCRRESEERANADAQRCHAVYAHMERLARLNMALVTQRRGVQPLAASTQSVVAEPEASGVAEEASRVDRLQATIVAQAREIERLRRQVKSMVPMLPLGGEQAAAGCSTDSESESEDDNQDQRDESERAKDGREKLPLTSLHAQLKARDATILRLEQHAAQLLDELDMFRETKRRAVVQYQQITKTQQSQLNKYAARIQQQVRTQREAEREMDGLKAYVGVLEKRLLSRAAHRRNDDVRDLEAVSREPRRAVVKSPR